jgi:hypothetical protein
MLLIKMDSNIESALIGIGGTVIGVALGAGIQYFFRKQDEKKETRRLLVTLLAKLDGSALKLVSSLIDLHIYCVSYIFLSKSESVNKDLQGFIGPHNSPSYPVEPSRIEFNRAAEKYDDLSNILFEYLSEFIFYVTDEKIAHKIAAYVEKARRYNTTDAIQKMEFNDLVKISSNEELQKSRDVIHKEYYEEILQPVLNELSLYLHNNYK